MAALFPIAPGAERRAERWVETMSSMLARTGGLALLLVTVVAVLSIVGRLLIDIGLGPVPGDFEIVQAGCGFAVCAFLPLCQLRRGHVTVDILYTGLAPGWSAWASLAGNILMTAASALLLWRLWVGMLEKFANGETTFILGMPVWWMYSVCTIGLAAAVLASAYTVWRSINAIASRQWARA